MNKKHPYYYQILGQMAITKIHKCTLVLFTHKGIHTTIVNFDKDDWIEMKEILLLFYKEFFFPTLRITASGPSDE